MNLSWTWVYPLQLFFFTVLWAEQRKLSGLHSLHYVFSFLSESLPGVPQYSVVGYVDDVPIISYTSESRRAGPRAPWMEKITNEDPQFWEESTETFEEVKKILQDSLRILMEQKNQPPGLHVVQAMEGCKLHEDGSAKWFEQYAYDGQNLSATTDPDADFQDQGNSEDLIECTEHLKKLLKYGEESLLRKVAPQTMVSRRKTGDRTFLTGYVYGFHPRDIEVKWVRDGVEIPWESKELLPNPDGTYQVRTTVEVQEGDDETHKYYLRHHSLPEIVTPRYDPNQRRLPVWLVVLVLVPMLVVVVIWKREPLKCFFPAQPSTGRDVKGCTSKGSPEAVKMISGDCYKQKSSAADEGEGSLFVRIPGVPPEDSKVHQCR